MWKLFDALPHTPFAMPNERRPKLKTWYWQPMRPYNGFAHAERVRNWQLMWWLHDCGALPLPKACDVCGIDRQTARRLDYHAECYFSLDRMIPLCDSCHRKVHQRAYRPQAWEELVQAHSRTGREWFALVPPGGEPDIAGWQRARFPGADPSNLLGGLLFQLPSSVPIPVFGATGFKK